MYVIWRVVARETYDDNTIFLIKGFHNLNLNTMHKCLKTNPSRNILYHLIGSYLYLNFEQRTVGKQNYRK